VRLRRRVWGRLAAVAMFTVGSLAVTATTSGATPELRSALGVITDLGGAGHELAVDPIRGVAYVSVPTLDAVMVVDLASGAVVDQRYVGPRPSGIVLSLDGSRLFAALNGAGAVGELDLETGVVTRHDLSEALGDARAWDVVQPRPGEVWVTANPGSGGFAYLVRLDLRTGEASRAGSSSVRMSPTLQADGDDVYVAESSGSPQHFYRFDVDTVRRVAEQDDVWGASQMGLSPDGRRLVTGSGIILDGVDLEAVGRVAGGVPVYDPAGEELHVARGTEEHGSTVVVDVFATEDDHHRSRVVTSCRSSGQSLGWARDLELLPDGGYAILLHGASVCLTEPPGPAITCDGIPATQLGTRGDDVMTFASGVVATLDGNDVVTTSGGDDRVCLGDGDDVLTNGGGTDVVFGDDGDDVLLLNDGNVHYDVQTTFDGGSGTDSVDASAQSWRTVDADLTYGWVRSPAIGPGAGMHTNVHSVERVVGSPLDDVLRGGDGPDQLFGGDGDDVIEGRGGDDRIDGGAGRDQVTYAGSPSGVTVDLYAGVADGTGADVLVGIEDVVGSAFDDVLTGDAGPNVLDGGEGADRIAGGGGDDVLHGGPHDDILDGDEGDDHLAGGTGNDLLTGGAGDDELDGGTGDDAVSFADAPGGVVVDLADGSGRGVGVGVDALVEIEDAVGSAHDDRLFGGPGVNVLLGLGGDDELGGRGGRDRLAGGPGDDRIRGGGSSDVLDLSDATGPVRVDLRTGAVSGEGWDVVSGVEDVLGSSYDDVLIGNVRANYLYGGAGADILRGMGRADWLDGGPGPDRVRGQRGHDVMYGRRGADRLVGGAGYDTATGGGGTDWCYAERRRGCENATSTERRTLRRSAARADRWAQPPSVPRRTTIDST
jgi:Ca2+-binding RTX toxin-like protein